MTERPVLYLVVCAAGPAEHIDELVDLLIADGWRVCLIVSPTAAPWLDRAALHDKTGYLVRVEWRMPGDPEPHPPADVVVAAPVTFNTMTKWALGINDTLALGVLNESLGAGLPIVAFPHVKAELAAHPAYAGHVAVLRAAGVVVAEGKVVNPAPGRRRWDVVNEALRSLHPR
ncbi:flavoprotein [Micromonospora sp. ALFpr18c]|uniref:flavoprotein n=1 Tax=unclassified Micromonospora TaxID=2617518 RepID=UPI00124B9161|nr:flavoprotein [Micromonospora sp. ALFpr18c]KAB1949741.1 flavoprotein [Micromonospora sp. ALFpr18c]